MGGLQMNNEPVAWIEFGIAGAPVALNHTWAIEAQKSGNKVPLYTHPAETITLAELRKTELYRTEQTRSLREFLEPKELTDEEIGQFKGEWYRGDYASFYDLVRAILRKAQDK